MCNRDEEQHYPDPGMFNPSPSRPPHLNQTVCGCRCGRASGHSRGSDGDDRQDDETLTLIASDASDDEFGSQSESTLGEHVDGHLIAGQSAFHGSSSRTSDSAMDAGHPTFSGAGSESNYSDRADSMVNEPGSDAQSMFTADSRSIHPMSPGPGIGEWAVLPYEYYFLARPLRLTPQLQYCRGAVASHLILSDDRPLGL